jgi:serine protease Do
MNPALRRSLALVAVFVVAFVAVFALRMFRGGDLRELLPGRVQPVEFRPETFTLPNLPPLEIEDTELLTRLNAEYARLTRAVVPSVVSINTVGVRTGRLMDPWGRTLERRYPTQGQGSGVIVTHEGHVITNHHVIANQTEIQVALHDGRTY